MSCEVNCELCGNRKCNKCSVSVCDKCSFDCELCYKTFCWDDCYMDDQGTDPRCYCWDCGYFCDEQGIFEKD